MSKKRFYIFEGTIRGNFDEVDKPLNKTEIVDLLNTQQATITHLEKVNGKNFAKRRLLEQDNLILRNENEQLRQKLDFYLLDEFEWKEKYGDGCMSEKRFVVDYEVGVLDTKTNEIICDTVNAEKVVDLLNEQEETIEELHISDNMGWKRAEHFEKELKTKKIYIKRLEYKVQKFKEMNNEQQATISQLQDLCGESDGENAKLRIENKRLQEEIERLQKIIDLTQYQLKVQDRILKEVGE